MSVSQNDDARFDTGGTAFLNQIHSQDHERILDVVDQLRAEGVSKFVSLPQIVVCGDQSSGKSSVLEAITGLCFPQKDNICTRFATELILRRAPTAAVTISIQPGSERSLTERDRLRSFRSPTVDLSQFAQIVASAEDFIGIGQIDQPFFSDVLRVEVTGPTQSHLTLVDLPGLYHAPDELQSEAGVEFVESLVHSYVRNDRSVILAVISAKSDIALQKVTAFTRKVDPQGERTMGIITKPDTLDPTSDMERSFLQLAKNTRMSLRLGWHVLKNREYQERHFNLDQRRESEARFFAFGVWSSLPRSSVGIDALKPRLSAMLTDHIVSQAPGFIRETQEAFDATKLALSRLGEARSTVADQRRYLVAQSERITALISDAVNGDYSDAFFGDAMNDSDYDKRIRAVVQNRLADFALDLRVNGEQRRIVEDPNEHDQWQTSISRADYVKELRQRQRRTRGRELMGTYNPLIVGDLFYLQAKPWTRMTVECINDLMNKMQMSILLIVEATVDEKTGKGLFDYVISHSFESIDKSLQAKMDELLRPQRVGHPITYNDHFAEAIQKARDAHQRMFVAGKLKDFFGMAFEDAAVTKSRSFRMDDMLDAITDSSSSDLEGFACSEAADCMQAYYKVAIEQYIGDFSILAVERCLLDPLLEIFRPRMIGELTDETVQAIAAEDALSQLERQRLTEKEDILQKSLELLRRLDRHNLRVFDSSKDSATSKVEAKVRSEAEKNGVTDQSSGPAETPTQHEQDEIYANGTVELMNDDNDSVHHPPDSTWSTCSPARPRKSKKKHAQASFWEEQ